MQNCTYPYTQKNQYPIRKKRKDNNININMLDSFYNYIINTRDLSYTIGLFYISYEMLSFPIGNFITSSSANQISIFITLFVIYTGWFKKLLIIK